MKPQKLLGTGLRIVKARAVSGPCGRGAHARPLAKSSFPPCWQATYIPQVFSLRWNFSAPMSPACLLGSGEQTPLLLPPCVRSNELASAQLSSLFILCGTKTGVQIIETSSPLLLLKSELSSGSHTSTQPSLPLVSNFGKSQGSACL